MIVSFAKTIGPLVLERKTVTRRFWKPRVMPVGSLFDGWSNTPRVQHARLLGHFEVTTPLYREQLGDMPASDLYAEGGRWVSRQEFIGQALDATADDTATVLRFALESWAIPPIYRLWLAAADYAPNESGTAREIARYAEKYPRFMGACEKGLQPLVKATGVRGASLRGLDNACLALWRILCRTYSYAGDVRGTLALLARIDSMDAVDYTQGLWAPDSWTHDHMTTAARIMRVNVG